MLKNDKTFCVPWGLLGSWRVEDLKDDSSMRARLAFEGETIAFEIKVVGVVWVIRKEEKK